jgi:NAD(P)-dependent dehydrogenase (short-subunit alcohol dehydrogenase family)
MTMSARLSGKVAVVLGGARGIGFAIVREFLREGATVFAGDVLPASEPVDAPSRISFSKVDATVPEQVSAFVNSALERSGQIDILVNNVGRVLARSVVDTQPEEFDDVFRVNVKSAYLGCRAVLPGMIERRSGSIINMSSNGGLIGRPGDPIYNASKHALVGLTRSLAVAYAHLGIRVNAVCPGPIDTPMLRSLVPDGEFEQRVPFLVASTPAARVGRADEVAQAVVFLASDESAFITGAAIPVDGGKAAGVMPNDRYRVDASRT